LPPGCPIPFAQVTRCYHLEVAPVEGCDLVQVKSLGKRDYAGIIVAHA
jgi:hypothetical protein